MKIIKSVLLAILLSLIMILSWSMGTLAGNVITGSNPPAPDDPTATLLPFLIVCVVNSFLLSLLIQVIRRYSGATKWSSLILYVFTIQFLLTQMETWFFSESFDISMGQILSIVIAGLVVSTVTVGLGIFISNKLDPNRQAMPLRFTLRKEGSTILVVLVVVCIVYPLIYMIFGYYVAWQNDNLRILYTGTDRMNSLFTQLTEAFSNGTFFFQILRGTIWLAVSIPVIVMLQGLRAQYLLVAIFTALLPSSLLFIPNPYMPEDVALSHFYETCSSNFLWGLILTYTVNNYLTASKSHAVRATNFR